MASRTPDYHLKALNKRTGERTGKVGAAWRNEDGSVSIKLDMFVSLIYDPDLLLTLFVNDRPAAPEPTDKFVDPLTAPLPNARSKMAKPATALPKEPEAPPTMASLAARQFHMGK